MPRWCAHQRRGVPRRCSRAGTQVTSKLHLLTAVHQALLAQAAGDLRTKTVHSEILWTLCPTNNVRVRKMCGPFCMLNCPLVRQISDAIKRFGLSATTTSLILIKVLPSSSNPPIPSIPDQARSLVHGQPLSFDSIPRVLTDWAAVRKVYKLNADPALVELRKVQGKEAEELERMYVDQTVVSLVATKSVAA